MDLARKMAGVLEFEKFVTLGRYLPMGAVSPENPACAPDFAKTDEFLADFSEYGGTIQDVKPSDNSTNADLEFAMKVWWLLESIEFSFQIFGTYKERQIGVPPQDWPIVPISFNKDFNFLGVPKPNEPPPSPPTRLYDCQNFKIYPTRQFYNLTEQNPFRSFDFYTNIFPFTGTENAQGSSADNPSNVLIELFCFFEPIDEAFGLTTSGLLIISTRNKPYTDVVIEGEQGESSNETRLVASQNIEISIFGKEITLYANFFVVNSNLDPLGVDLSITGISVAFNKYIQYVSSQ